MPRELPAHPPASFFFDRFELRLDDRLLLREGEAVPLRAKAFDLLAVLVERAGHLVTKAELLDRVWPGLVVEENNIASQMAALRKVVGNGLVVTVPGSGYRFVADVRRAGGPAASADVDAVPAAVATTAPLVPGPRALQLFGRDDDLHRLHALVEAGGCVTLTGPGGVGKTALAAALLRQRPEARTAWVDLAVLSDGAQVAGAVCRALGVATPPVAGDAPAALAAALGDTQGRGAWLLVLDNAEHVVDEVAALAAQLGALLPALAVLVTSQLPLRIAGERVHALEPLGLPGDGTAGEQALDSAAVQMLVERIRAGDARLVLGADAMPMLAALCARLDGLPLAIEMAASMVPLLGLGGVLDATDERFRLLRRGRREAPARHQTLRAALEWSHGLLAPAQQQALHRLGVFASSFSLELATAVIAEPGADRWEAVDLLGELVERSLVTSLHSDPPRYRLLETVRSFALEALDAGADRSDGRATRRRAVAGLTEALKQAAPAEAGGAAAAELPNVPEALRWARTHDAAAAVELTLAAAAVATWTPWLGEAARWVEACEPLLGELGAAQQAAWWRELARYQTFVRGARSVEAAGKAAAIERTLGNAEALFWSLIPLLRSRVIDAAAFEACRAEAEGLLERHPEWPALTRVVFSGSLALEYRRRGEFETALGHQQAEAEQARAAGLLPHARNAESNVAATLIGLGRHEEALARLDAQAAAAGEVEDGVGAHNRVRRLAALMALGRGAEAEAMAPTVLAWCRRFDLLDVEPVLAELQARQGRPRAAALVLGHYRQSLVRRGAELPADDHAPWRAAERLATEAIGAEGVLRLAERGARLTTAEADAAMLAREDIAASAT